MKCRMPEIQEIYDEQDTSSEESGDEQDTPTEKPESELNSSATLSNQQPTLTSTPNEEQGEDDTGKVEGHNETATDSGMGTSGIFSETSAQTKTSECQIVGIKTISTFSKKDEDAANQEPTVSANLQDTEEAREPLKPMFPKGFLICKGSVYWKPSRPKWHYKADPDYFHCHQDSPELCDRCSREWGYYMSRGQAFDGEDWV